MPHGTCFSFVCFSFVRLSIFEKEVEPSTSWRGWLRYEGLALSAERGRFRGRETVSLIIWIIVGLVAGLIARAVVPGRQAMGWVLTTLLGLAGSIVGGFVGTILWHRNAGEFSPGGLVLSIIGAVIILVLYMLVQRRTVHA
jgi:uncharacterized membrane protein YeaQ/YmgE (transglycosylase-associated protein family)